MTAAGREWVQKRPLQSGVDESGRTGLVAISVLTSMDEDAPLHWR